MPEIRQITPTQLKPIYKKYMRKEFPRFELRPFKMMSRLIYDNKYVAYGYYNDDNSLLAYACIYLQTDDIDILRADYALLDYFAVVPEMQNHGIGSVFLRELANEAPVTCGLFIECENPNGTKDKSEKDIRERRIEFYKKNGCIATGIKCKILCMTFDLMLLENEQNSEKLNTHTLLKSVTMMYRAIYGKRLSKIIKVYAENICAERE